MSYIVFSANGQNCHYNNKGQRHRLDGPAVERADGSKFWFQNGRLHREDGPAIEFANRDKEWFQNGQRHRLDGPAIEYIDGTKDWFYKGKYLEHIKSQEQYEKWLRLKAFW